MACGAGGFLVCFATCSLRCRGWPKLGSQCPGNVWINVTYVSLLFDKCHSWLQPVFLSHPWFILDCLWSYLIRSVSVMAPQGCARFSCTMTLLKLQILHGHSLMRQQAVNWLNGVYMHTVTSQRKWFVAFSDDRNYHISRSAYPACQHVPSVFSVFSCLLLGCISLVTRNNELVITMFC